MIDHNNLEEFSDPETYDSVDPSDTGVAFYRGLAQETGGPVLEIACGTGRVTIPIAQSGFVVTGLDIVPGMVAQARRKSAALGLKPAMARWVVGDARSFDLSERFRLIFLTGNAFQAFLTRADQEALLARVRAHLADEGLFAFETRNPRWSGLATRAAAYDGLFSYLETQRDERSAGTYVDGNGQTVQLSRTQEYDHINQILHWTAYRRWVEANQEQCKITRIAVRFTFPQELLTLLHYNGFTVIRQYGDWNLEPLTESSPSIIVVCHKRQGE